MSETQSTLKLTYQGAQKMINAAVAAASEMGVPQCISVVDQGGHMIAFARMDGAFSMSLETSLRKAQTAACYGIPSGNIEAGMEANWTPAWRHTCRQNGQRMPRSYPGVPREEPQEHFRRLQGLSRGLSR